MSSSGVGGIANGGEPEGIVAKISRTLSDPSAMKEAAEEVKYVAKRLAMSTGKAAWIAGTTFLVLVIPLIIEMDREQQLTDLELQQQSLLGSQPSLPPI